MRLVPGLISGHGEKGSKSGDFAQRIEIVQDPSLTWTKIKHLFGKGMWFARRSKAEGLKGPGQDYRSNYGPRAMICASNSPIWHSQITPLYLKRGTFERNQLTDYGNESSTNEKRTGPFWERIAKELDQNGRSLKDQSSTSE